METNQDIKRDELVLMITESMKDYPPLLKVDDVSKILQLGKNNTYILIKSGEFRIIKIGKHIRITKAELIMHLVNLNK